jgi:hypothetical protein
MIRILITILVSIARIRFKLNIGVLFLISSFTFVYYDTQEDTLIWKRKLWIALCGELALEEALNLW